MKAEGRLELTYQPYIQKDLNEPFPIRYFGYTVFRDREPSPSFPKLTLDPSELGAAYIIEYAVYYDYDIQHLYDLEHVWVAVDQAGTVSGCWSSFHGMRMRADRLPSFHLHGEQLQHHPHPQRRAPQRLVLLRQRYGQRGLRHFDHAL